MDERRASRRASFRLSALAVAALVATAGHAGSDCLEPLRANAGWSCHAEASNGQAVDYCLERTNTFGADPASQFFKLIATGPYPSHCSCGAKGKLPGAAFGEDKAYLCLYPDTDSVVSGRITKQRIAGQTFSAAYAVRTVFSCEPDPACDVPPVVDPDLPAESGAIGLKPADMVDADVVAAGDVALGYLPGCGGYASEAPTFVFRVAASQAGLLRFRFDDSTAETDAAGILVMTPSGEAHCAEEVVDLPPGPGSYAVWVRALAPGAPVEGEIEGSYLVQ